MRQKWKEWWSTQRAKNPGRMILGVILLFNIALLLLSATVISALSLKGTEQMGFIEAAYYTVTMILDAGCIQFVIEDIGEAGLFISVFCLAVVIVGMISFTGAVIGYVTNYISGFIEAANSGKHKIYMSDHVVILNWNSRASEIINDFLYKEKPQRIVVLVNDRKQEVQLEIEERLAHTVAKENKKIQQQYAHLPWLKRKLAIHKHRFRRNLVCFVREGDVFSYKQLSEISLERARSIIILGNSNNDAQCKYEKAERDAMKERGNSQTIKTLMQVADIVSAESSNDNQRVIVEITDEWTWNLVAEIIKTKQVEKKCHIVPVRVNQVLGQILSQFSLMPELNMVYAELFSNKGVEIYANEQPAEDLTAFSKRYLAEHRYAIPLTFMESGKKSHCFYCADKVSEVTKRSPAKSHRDYSVKLNDNYWIEQKHVIILGHNSKSRDIMQGFVSFCGEWNHADGKSIVDVVVIDEKKSLEKMDYYKDYPFVVETVAADIFDKKLICDTIERVISHHVEDTSILILSDDTATKEDVDANALANLIYVQEIINRKCQSPDFDPHSVDVIVEIINPKHHDIVNSYNVNNVIISNRYVSKMVAQIGEMDALFDFYTDILRYDEDGDESKEIYAKKISRYFSEVPEPCTAEELIRAVLEASCSEKLPPEKREPAFALGYVDADSRVHLFCGDQAATEVRLTGKDKIIVFARH